MLHHQKGSRSQDLGVIGNNFIELSDSGTSYRPDQVDDMHPLNDADNVEDPDDSLPLAKAARKYPKVVAYSLTLMLVVLGWGYDLVLVGSIPAVDAFKRDYGEMYKDELIIPAMWLSLWTAASPLGMAIGSLFAGWYQDVVGRRMSLFTGSAVTGVGAAIILCSYLPPDIEARRGMFFAGKVIQGLSVGLLKVTAMTYMSETAPTCLRGSALALVPTGNLMGQFLGSIVIYLCNNVEGREGYIGAFGSQFILVIAPFIVGALMPESPAYLEERGYSEKAFQATEKLYAPRANPMIEMRKIRASIAEEKKMSDGATYMTCFTKAHLRRTLIVILANFLPTMFGLDLLGKSSYFLQLIGMPSSTSLLILIAGVVVGIIANGAGVWVMSRVNRRPAILISLGGATALWAGMGISGFWRGPVVANVTAGLLTLIIIVCGVGVWPGSYAVMGETSSLRLRAKTQAVGGVAQQGTSVMMSFVLPYAYNPDAGDMAGKTGFILAGLSLLAAGLCWYYIPEMKGRSSLEIDQMFDLNLGAREFKHWNSPEAEPRASE
ncbi:unnamed protein product [Clonostachys byssicola]|uniref:Major facilitator superfamily (MFS) profile domain-containing protein n=1 Tax=Clonostachys byssicola TaxID=160290 RepID=A0A9N9XZN2_9HYPO|nr:unnamed protein product [Clonostachys byssicola]